MKRLLGVLFISFFLSGVAHSATFDPSLKWKTLKTDNFLIHYDEKLEDVARNSACYLEEAHERLVPKIGWDPWGRTEVVIADSEDRANGSASTLPYNWVNLRVAAPDPDNVLSFYDNWMRLLIMHEYTHILHIDQVYGVMKAPRWVLQKVVSPNGTVPGWIREGIAVYDETSESTTGRGYSTYSDMLLRTAMLNKKFPRLDQMDGLGWRWPSYQSMYIYGVKFLQYLSDTYGEKKLMEFNNRLAGSPFLFLLNHQARNTFTDIEFDSKKVNTHYTKVRKKGSPRSKSFYKLWDDWTASLEKKYAEEAKKLEAVGVTPFEVVATGETVISSPALSPDGKYLAYARERMKGPSELHLVDLETGKNKVIKKKLVATDIAFSPDSKKIAYSMIGSWKTYNSYSDIWEYDIESKKTKRITSGERAKDPFYSPDGKRIIFVKQNAGTGWLAEIDIESKKVTDLKFDNSTYWQFADPAISPDGKKLAVTSWQFLKGSKEVGRWDIYVYNYKAGKIWNVKKITDDIALNSHPVWSKNSKEIYFVSDRTGINNIYKASKNVGASKRVTNVMTGVFQPALSPDNETLYVKYYNGDGYDLRKTSLKKEKKYSSELQETFVKLTGKKGKSIDTKKFSENWADKLSPKKYNPFGKSLFLPRFVIPNVAILDSAVYLGAFTGGADVLRWHNWTAGVNYRTDYASNVGYFFNYWYNRYKPTLSLGMASYSVKYGTIYTFCTAVDADGNCTSSYNKRLFEERIRGAAGVSYPYGSHSFSARYFYEDRGSNLSSAEFNGLVNVGSEPTLGRYSGLSLSYGYGKVAKYPASISYENGRRFVFNFTITDKYLGSSEINEQQIIAADYREYISLPIDNHVIALRVKGGWAWGDELTQGTFIMGGALGEGAFGGGDSLFYFPLRGLPIAALSRTRSLLFSFEYRIPVVSPQRGLGTAPFYVENIHFAPFADYGNAWNSSSNTVGNGQYFFNDFFLSTGAEFRGDFIIGHGLPVTGRLGYAIIVVNRDRIAAIEDPLLKTPAKYGMIILQLGTSF